MHPRVESFSPHLFWDTDKTTIDFDKHKKYVVENVLTHGMLSDWQLIVNLYGREAIKTIALNLRHLDDRTLYFCAAYFKEPLNQFRCYTIKQSNLKHWDY